MSISCANHLNIVDFLCEKKSHMTRRYVNNKKKIEVGGLPQVALKFLARQHSHYYKRTVPEIALHNMLANQRATIKQKKKNNTNKLNAHANT